MADDSSAGNVQLVSGRMFNPLKPDANQISIEDIAHAGSMQCRYGGHSRFFYSVNEHAIQVSNMIEQWGGTIEEQIAGLLHDCDEALGLPDLPRPVKKNMPGYREAGERIQEAVFRKYDLTFPMAPLVILADNSILFLYERPVLMGHRNEEFWQYDGELRKADKVYIMGLEPIQTKKLFLARFNELYDKRYPKETVVPTSNWGKE